MRAGRVAGWTALAAALLAAAGALLPIPPQLLANRLDPSFAAALHFGAAHGYAVGRQLISTFGPLGFVFYAQYDPHTWAWLLALRAILAAATCTTLAWLGWAALGSPWGAALAVVVCAPFLAPPDVWFLTLPALAILIELAAERRPPLALRVALGAAIGLASLIKFTVLIAALAALAPMAVAEVLVQRRVPAVAVSALIVAAVGWLLAGQHAADCLRYLDWSWREISSGYAAGMQIPADRGLLLHALAVSAAVFAAAALLARRRLASRRWGVDLALAGVLYLLLRAGFVRADVHTYITCFGLLVLAILLALLWDRRPARLGVAALLVALLPGGLWLHTVAVQGPSIMYFRPLFPAQAIGRLATAPLVVGGAALTGAQARRLTDIRGANPLPPLSGSVDVYSYDQALVLAHGLDYRPRPVFHSYMAYTPRLARANAEFLLGPDAPQWILFRVSPIDGGLPALDDAPSWPIFMTSYRPVGRAGQYALLQRRDAALPWRLEPLGRVTTETGKPVTVPSAADGPIWARIELDETRGERLRAALIAAPLSYVGIARRDGQTRGFRLLRALARDGFLLSPLVEDTADFMRLLSLPPDAERGHDSTVLTVLLEPEADADPRPVTVEFSRLVVGAPPS